MSIEGTLSYVACSTGAQLDIDIDIDNTLSNKLYELNEHISYNKTGMTEGYADFIPLVLPMLESKKKLKRVSETIEILYQ